MGDQIRVFLAAVWVLGLTGCSSAGILTDRSVPKRVVIDNTYHGPELPGWTRDGKVGWEDKGVVYFKAQHTVRGDQRINSCFDLAKMDLKESLMTEISTAIKGEVNFAAEGISEASEAAITKSFSQQLEAEISGLKQSEQFFERYLTGDVERVDCYVMALMSKSDYDKLKSRILQRAARSDAQLAQLLRRKQRAFFDRATDPSGRDE